MRRGRRFRPEYSPSRFTPRPLPGVVLLLAALAFNLVGDGLRDGFDVRVESSGIVRNQVVEPACCCRFHAVRQISPRLAHMGGAIAGTNRESTRWGHSDPHDRRDDQSGCFSVDPATRLTSERLYDRSEPNGVVVSRYPSSGAPKRSPTGCSHQAIFSTQH